ncbi:hypothetical protein Cni_G00334 [Canna indica]|uniref:Uncharacterized protein n=1 Tax=Canna indica TaxID=4628 RepID=A0AAQ3PX13_9LILI|nr:hypothetical protein Cni_G00334 [Canna indica]
MHYCAMKVSCLSHALLWALILVAIFFSPTTRAPLCKASPDEDLANSCDRHLFLQHHRRHHHHHHHGDRAVSSRSASLLRGLPSRCLPSSAPVGRRQPPPRSLPSEEDEIDPRYGVAKWLVPTGPNPLHH